MINAKYKPGLRAIKTAIAVLVCLIISNFLKRPDAFYASIAAVICMRQTYNQTFQIGTRRLIGTALGGTIGYFALIFLQSIGSYKQIINIVFTPICILLIIYLCNLINYTAAVEIGCIVLLSIIVRYDRTAAASIDALYYVIFRIIDTSIGVIVAMLVNRLIFPNEEKTATQEPTFSKLE